MDGDSIACARGRGGNFRQRHHHVSALRHRSGFDDCELFRLAMRRFSYVLEWAGIVVAVSTLILRLPLVLAYFINIPRVLDYLPIARFLMRGLIIAFCSLPFSLVLHNETLIEAMRAHIHFIQKNAGRLAWFLVICGIHFY